MVVGTAFDEPQVVALADRADAGVFGSADPSVEQIDEFWREVDGIVGGMMVRAGSWGRLRARLALRSLFARTRFALPDPRPRAAAAPVAAKDAEVPTDQGGTP